jgi:HAD superfamily hydrolase (TIGR01490 family)
MKKAIAVFDIDGTVLAGSTAERIFVRNLIARGELGLTEGINFARRFFSMSCRDWMLATKGNKYYLKGKDARRIEELAAAVFQRAILPRISEKALRTIEEHRSNGLEIVLLSGTLDALIRCFQEHLGANHVHGSNLAASRGRYTGDITGIYPYGAAKAEIVRAFYGSDAYDLSASYAYANHETDLDFLSLFGHPMIVNPSDRLAERARRAGIGIIQF